jgi:hypothetical protein
MCESVVVMAIKNDECITSEKTNKNKEGNVLLEIMGKVKGSSILQC